VRKRDLGDLVKAASSDLEAPIRRGRGLEGMLSGEAGQDHAEQDQQSTSTHVNNTTSTQDALDTNGQADNTATKPDELKPVQRVVKSFRLRDDISHRIEIFAAQERRKIYEVVEEALEEYLARRTQ
jgi:hypothetical protein